MPHEHQRIEQQGLGYPILSWVADGYRCVIVGGRILKSKDWQTFHDFLVDFVIDALDFSWLSAEMAKGDFAHPVAKWYKVLFKERRKNVCVDVTKLESNGSLASLMLFNYNIYLVAHNATLFSDIVKRIKSVNEFHGVLYELFVAAQFIKAGIEIDYRFYDGKVKTKCEFVAESIVTGKTYSVEAKARHIVGMLGSTRGANLDIKKNVLKQFRKALAKNAEHERVIFIDTNFPDKTDQKNGVSILKYLASIIQDEETTLLIDGRPAPSAYVFLTNFPYHYVEGGFDYQCSAILIGFKKDCSFNTKFYSLNDALTSRDRHQDMFEVFRWLKQQDVPPTFDGESPEFAFAVSNEPRLLIGSRYIIPNSLGHDEIGILESACVMENEKKIVGVYKLQTGEQIRCECPMTLAEIAAYKRHPDTFFGSYLPVGRVAQDAIDVFDFVFDSYKDCERNKLLEFMKDWPDYKSLVKLPQNKLARLYSLRMAEEISKQY
jgi:hypothetical protein